MATSILPGLVWSNGRILSRNKATMRSAFPYADLSGRKRKQRRRMVVVALGALAGTVAAVLYSPFQAGDAFAATGTEVEAQGSSPIVSGDAPAQTVASGNSARS